MSSEFSPIGVAVIGTGVMGKNHCRVLAGQLPGIASLVGVHDCDADTRVGIANTYNVKSYGSLDAICDDQKVRAAVVAVPTRHHLVTARKLIEAKKHVLVEKPLAMNVDECLELIELAERNGVVLTVGHIERHNPVVRKLTEVVASGHLGAIRSIKTTRLGLLPPRVPEGIVGDLGHHDISIITGIIGLHLPEEMQVRGRSFNGEESSGFKEDEAFITLESPDLTTTTHLSWRTGYKKRRVEVNGALSAVEVDLVSQVMMIDNGPQTDGSLLTEMYQIRGEPLVFELTDFMTAIRDSNHRPLVSGMEGARTVLLCGIATELIRAGDRNNFVLAERVEPDILRRLS